MKYLCLLFSLICINTYAEENSYNDCFAKIGLLHEEVLYNLAHNDPDFPEYYKGVYANQNYLNYDSLLILYNKTYKTCIFVDEVNSIAEYKDYMFQLQIDLGNLSIINKNYKNALLILDRNFVLLDHLNQDDLFNEEALFDFFEYYINCLTAKDTSTYVDQYEVQILEKLIQYVDKIQIDNKIKLKAEVLNLICRYISQIKTFNLNKLHDVNSNYSNFELTFFNNYAQFIIDNNLIAYDYDNYDYYTAIAFPFIINAQKALQNKDIKTAENYIHYFDKLSIAGKYLRIPINYIYITYADYYIQQQDYLSAFIYIGTFVKYAYLFKNAGDIATYNYLIDNYNFCAEKLNRKDLLLQK